MTPKEKAHELVEKFRRYTPAEEEFEFEYAKQCALIAVEEILSDELGVMPAKWMGDYWNEVKSEIEKL